MRKKFTVKDLTRLQKNTCTNVVENDIRCVDCKNVKDVFKILECLDFSNINILEVLQAIHAEDPAVACNIVVVLAEFFRQILISFLAFAPNLLISLSNKILIRLFSGSAVKLEDLDNNTFMDLTNNLVATICTKLQTGSFSGNPNLDRFLGLK